MTEATRRSNVDPDEIAKFERLAARWWDPTSEFRPLHEINPLRLDWITARAPLAGKTVVDVGCGGGILAEAMATRGARVTGIDLGEAPLAVARLHLKESGQQVDYRKIAAEDLALEQPGGFDIVTCMEMLVEKRGRKKGADLFSGPMTLLFTAFPVPQPSALMGDCQNSQECRLSGSVNDGKRKPVKKQTPIRRFDNHSGINKSVPVF